MKTITISIITLLLIFASVLVNAQTPMVQGKLEYMLKESSDRVFEIAQKENKPVLIYVHSQSCFSSKKFSREIMNHEKVKSMLRKKYICLNADVASKIGQQMASKHGVLMTPALFLYSPDKGIVYQAKLEMDTFEMLSQFRSFISACNLLDQVKMQQQTTTQSEKEIIRQIGRSYALRDFQRDKSGDISQRISIRTLNLAYFKEFEIGYREEWETMVAANNKKSVTTEASIK